ncbi:hypothetical protein CDAR_249631 [Caerostris darwini]|uniref:Uncharacterized protein n=1 Tax=Caerostris darwini TaxID=1538125 RepID=A0AAV4RL63_9ARAC|nr:hypothetical protein CDAR_249631 [Caerostris darwini]
MRGNQAIVFCPVVEQVLSLIWKMSQGAADKDCNFRNPFPLESGWCSCGTNYVRGAVGSHIESGHWLQMVAGHFDLKSFDSTKTDPVLPNLDQGQKHPIRVSDPQQNT